MMTKEKVLADLLNYSSYDSPLNNCYFFKKYQSGSTLNRSQFDRELERLMNELKCDQIDAESLSKPFYLIYENEEGYYVAKNRDEALLGSNYQLSQVKSEITVSSNFIKMIGRAFPEEDPAQLNLL